MGLRRCRRTKGLDFDYLLAHCLSMPRALVVAVYFYSYPAIERPLCFVIYQPKGDTERPKVVDDARGNGRMTSIKAYPSFEVVKTPRRRMMDVRTELQTPCSGIWLTNRATTPQNVS